MLDSFWKYSQFSRSSILTDRLFLDEDKICQRTFERRRQLRIANRSSCAEETES